MSSRPSGTTSAAQPTWRARARAGRAKAIAGAAGMPYHRHGLSNAGTMSTLDLPVTPLDAPPNPPPASPAAGADAQPYDLRHGLACGGVSLLVGLTQGLGIFLVNNNLTGIQGPLGATAAEASWLTTAYFATALSAAVLLTKMRLQFGLRRFAEWGIVVYLLISVVHL